MNQTRGLSSTALMFGTLPARKETMSYSGDGPRNMTLETPEFYEARLRQLGAFESVRERVEPSRVSEGEFKGLLSSACGRRTVGLFEGT